MMTPVLEHFIIPGRHAGPGVTRPPDSALPGSGVR